MAKFTVTAASVTLHHGTLRNLTPRQLADRRHNLRSVAKDPDAHEILQPVSFKRGETLEFDGELSRTLAAEVEVAPGVEDLGALAVNAAMKAEEQAAEKPKRHRK